MKKTLRHFAVVPVLLFLVLACVPTIASAITTQNGKSFFSPQPVSAMLAPQTGMFEDFCRGSRRCFRLRSASYDGQDASPHHERDDEKMDQENPLALRSEASRRVSEREKNDDGFFFAATPFFSRSNAGKSLRRYFFPEGKDELVINGSDVAEIPDISGTWLQIMGQDPAVGGVGLLFNDFHSKISVNPVYENLGSNFNFYKSFGEHFFVAAELAVLQSKVTHGFAEFDVRNQTDRETTDRINFGGGAGARVRREPESRLYSLNATEAFTNPFWNYGKLATNSIKKEGINDLACKIGLQFKLGSLFVKAVLPTSQKPTAVYMFEPLTGNGSHFGLGFGGTLALEKELTDVTLHLRNGAEYVYLFENTQRRTFDLTNGAWSRYLLMRELNHSNSSPGVNYLTLSSKVTPGHTVNWQTQVGVQLKKLTLNLGYDFYFAQEESVRLSDGNFATQFNVADEQITNQATIAGVANQNIPININFIPSATIRDHAGNSAFAVNAVVIPTARIDAAVAGAMSASNIQIQTAQQPAKLVSQLGISASFEDVRCGLPLMLSTGYSYNFDHNKTALEGWHMWLQVGLKI